MTNKSIALLSATATIMGGLASLPDVGSIGLQRKSNRQRAHWYPDMPQNKRRKRNRQNPCRFKNGKA